MPGITSTGENPMKMRTGLLAMLTLVTLVSSAFGQQTRPQSASIRWELFDARENPNAYTTMFGNSWSATPLQQTTVQDPFLFGFAVRVDTPRASVEVFKPLHAIQPGLAPPQSAVMQLPQTVWGTYHQPQPFDGLVSFVGAIRLNLQNAEAAQEGWSWSFAVGAPQNGYANVGLSVRYKFEF